MRKLYFTTGSPFARAVRLVMIEKGLDFERDETSTTPSVEYRLKSTPTLQVPALVDGDKQFWDSTVILEYLMTAYPSPSAPAGHQPLAHDYARPSHYWQDRLAHATLQTFGASTATISQLEWSGVRHEDNAHGTRSAIRNQHLLDWFETQLISDSEGFVPGAASAQDFLLACWCQFIERRPLRLTWKSGNRSKLVALVDRLGKRPSFGQEPALWWEPGVTYATPEEHVWAKSRTIYEDSPSFKDWTAQSGKN